MDIATIDNQYNQLHQQAGQTIQELRDLAAKLQTAAQSGDQNAREWLLDLKSIALAIQAEQNQVSNLLQSIHNYADAQQNQYPQQMPNWQQPPMQPGYPPQQPGYGGYPQQQGAGGMLGGLLNSGFGRAIMTGAGFGIGDDIINKIF